MQYNCLYQKIACLNGITNLTITKQTAKIKIQKLKNKKIV